MVVHVDAAMLVDSHLCVRLLQMKEKRDVRIYLLCRCIRCTVVCSRHKILRYNLL